MKIIIEKRSVKTVYGYFKRQIDEVSHEKTRTRLRTGSFKRETESLLIAVQNNAIRINYIKAKIDKTLQMGRTTVWLFQATNKQNLTREDLDMAKKRKPYEKN